MIIELYMSDTRVSIISSVINFVINHIEIMHILTDLLYQGELSFVLISWEVLLEFNENFLRGKNNQNARNNKDFGLVWLWFKVPFNNFSVIL